MFRVLIVEDDPMVLSINQRYLQKIPNFMVAGTADSYEHAIQLTSQYFYDLILVDIHLKSGNGLDLLKTWRKREYPAEIIMITAASQQEALRISKHYGVTDYILKPFQFKRFKQSIELFQQNQLLLSSNSVLTQKEIDSLHHSDPLSISEIEMENKLEKGLTQTTLDLIVSLIQQQKAGFTVSDITQATELSHVSVRKYLHYLESTQQIEMRLEYGTVGRPTSVYYLIENFDK
ncbi:MAG: response regulator [Carnobacterium sp.]|jgi:response regulator of citrate/malate metabolism|uniref:Transcriptional regulatory protein n=2 Tax=Carnobacterium maltaromaticum TaxID=2751 RepID=K8ECS4_CARML|nr:response regulator [Carnobacterium maltaromaticum]AOA03513.1 two-component response regulator [Carnobacterium maltaromaticum]KRN61153.1 Response regulator of citrate malate metabolism [Carnobacterium maltaromaticum DSM 20342]KRN73036.1 Response regulator of citrate malate metabolism [Carnobacterium maltaromaticum]KRN86324.1 Response regulator of citrate malate metabolism [Carnobacterium maltaromaticum]MBC9789390.1 response regulator [Carnobacterium maltaromaticum]